MCLAEGSDCVSRRKRTTRRNVLGDSRTMFQDLPALRIVPRLHVCRFLARCAVMDTIQVVGDFPD